jgi:GntR family transcriptional regulator, galactonate operon transcriptional repressor
MIYREPPFMRAAPPRKRNLCSHLVEEIGSRIVRGELAAEAVLPNEADLGRQFRASRSVVREAVKTLAAKGLLDSRTRTGTRVLPSAHWNLLDLDVLGWRYAAMPREQFFRELYEIRRLIEPGAAALAAERASAAEIAALRDAYTAMESADPETDFAIDADMRFHRMILSCSHNELLVQMGGVIGVGLLISFRISSHSYGVSLPKHFDVFDAISRHDADGARAAMEQLLVGTREFLERELEGAAQRDREASSGSPALVPAASR